VQETIDAAEKAYKDNFEAEVASFAGANQGSLLGDLINMVSTSSFTCSIFSIIFTNTIHLDHHL
jgi:hypothetical protein